MKPAREPVDEFAETQVLNDGATAAVREPRDADTAALYEEYARELASDSAQGAPKQRRTR